MPAKKKEIELSPDKQALIQAIATGNTEGVPLAAVQELLSSLGITGVAKGIQVAKSTSRKDIERHWQTARELNKDEKSLIRTLPKVLGQTPTFTTDEEVRDFSQDEVDLMVEEMGVLNPVESIAKGRKDALRTTGINVVSFRHDGTPFSTGALTSLKHGKKITVEKRENKPNYAALKEEVPEDVWQDLISEHETTSTTYEVDEEKVAKALGEGRITLEQFAALIPDPTMVFSLKDLKEGDPIA